jgi:hypothetical protein
MLLVSKHIITNKISCRDVRNCYVNIFFSGQLLCEYDKLSVNFLGHLRDNLFFYASNET